MRMDEKIVVKQFALHIDTWYTSRAVGKEQLTKIEAVANTVHGLWQV